MCSLFFIFTYSALWQKTKTSRASSCVQEWTRKLSFMSSRPAIRNWLLRGKVIHKHVHSHTHIASSEGVVNIGFCFMSYNIRSVMTLLEDSTAFKLAFELHVSLNMIEACKKNQNQYKQLRKGRCNLFISRDSFICSSWDVSVKHDQTFIGK